MVDYDVENLGIDDFSSKKREIFNTIERSTHSILAPFVPMIKKLLFYDIEEIKDENLKNDLREYLETNKELSELFKMIRKFKEIIFSKKPQRLKFWIEKAKKINVKELNSFITLIESDIDAVKNAIKYDYSNGLIEHT